jgi:hypothetical protein
MSMTADKDRLTEVAIVSNQHAPFSNGDSKNLRIFQGIRMIGADPGDVVA